MSITHLLVQRVAALLFTAWIHREWIAEMMTQQPTMPASSVMVMKAAEMLALYAA